MLCWLSRSNGGSDGARGVRLVSVFEFIRVLCVRMLCAGGVDLVRRRVGDGGRCRVLEDSVLLLRIADRYSWIHA